MQKILVTGGFGQMGSDLVPALQKKFGKENVVSLAHKVKPDNFDGIVEIGEVTDKKQMADIIKKYEIDTVYHLASLLSATGEANPQLAWDVNINGLKNILDIAVEKKLRVFWPSSIAVFGPTTPRDNTPQRTVLEPTTMYGVTKLAGELLCQYYTNKYALDIRSLRYPGLISYKAEPGGGTTDYAVAIFYEAIKSGKYECFVSKDTMLPMMYMDDAIEATLKLMEAPWDSLTIHTSYNLAAISFTAEQLASEIQKRMPLEVTYKPDSRQKIADSWPKTIDDSVARFDWGWSHKFDLVKICDVMIENLSIKLNK